MGCRREILAICASACASALALWAVPAQAGGAYCTPDWKPENPDLGCASQIVIAPGNDSRVNLFLLMQDRAGSTGAGLNYPDPDWETFMGRNFLRWGYLREAWFPSSPEDGEDYPYWHGTRCQTIDSGKADYLAALAMLRGLKPDERSLLETSRGRLSELCADGPLSDNPPGEGGYFTNIGANGIGDVPMGYMAYLEGAASFYGGEWARASEYFTLLRDAEQGGWVEEAARYMLARTALNEAIVSGEDEWGFFDQSIAKTEAAARAEQGFREYLTAYPQGKYAASARGLIRKALWLQANYAVLGQEYAAMLASVDPASVASAELVEEVDDKYLIREKTGEHYPSDPMLLAAHDLMQMRAWRAGVDGAGQLGAAELAAQSESFWGHDELYGFIKANHAFYVEQDYRAVLQLLPDVARAESYTPLAFSRQYLRGLALHALKDRNEEGFWLDLIKGSKGIWQRPAVELALARQWEHSGQIDKVFANGSPITDSRIRRILLAQSAPPAILKAQARDASASESERSFALFVALLRQLEHGEYAGFGADIALASRFTVEPDEYGLWSVYDSVIPPLNLFTAGEWSDGYACPSLSETAARLARNPRDVKGRLCLGDFYRLNGFDDFSFGDRYDAPDSEGELGERDYYPGKAIPRHDFYTAIIADPRAAREDKAYALYRAVRCYAPANMNTCGGEGVDKAQRERWFNQLKRSYGNTRWAQDLEYYW